jgi:hypothetical protein
MLTMRSFVCFGEDHVKRYGEDCADDKQLEHLVVQGADEKRKPAFSDWLLTIVVSKFFGSFRKVVACKPDLGVHS